MKTYEPLVDSFDRVLDPRIRTAYEMNKDAFRNAAKETSLMVIRDFLDRLHHSSRVTEFEGEKVFITEYQGLKDIVKMMMLEAGVSVTDEDIAKLFERYRRGETK